MTIRRYMKREGVLVPEGYDPERTIVLDPFKARLGGFFRIQLRRKSGSLKYDTGWFGNLITDYGMDSYGSSHSDGNAAPYCCVGTGSSAPSFSDTTLVAPLALSPSFATPTGMSYVAGPPAFAFQNEGWAYALGAVIGNIAEIGAGPVIGGGGTLLSRFRTFSRQLILDNLGNPTTISVTSADQLNTSYQLRLYYDLSDSTTSITISGTTYGGTIRRSLTGGLPNGVFGTTAPDPPSWGSTRAYLFLGTIGTTSSQPGGANLLANSNSYGIYTPGTFTRTASSHWGTTGLGTVQSMQLGSSALGFWQVNLAPGFAKTSSNTLDINWSMSWARY